MMWGPNLTAYLLPVFIFLGIIPLVASSPMGSFRHHNHTEPCSLDRRAPDPPGSRPSRPKLTHFVAFEIVNRETRPAWDRALEALKRIGRQGQIFPPEAVVSPDTLHLTIAVMNLDSPDKLEAATDRLQRMNLEHLLRSVTDMKQGADTPVTPITVNIEGLGSFGRPEAAPLLWARPVDPTDRLDMMGLSILNHFQMAGLATSDYRQNLHMTVMKLTNARGGPTCPAPPRTIDATSLIARYGNHKWAEDLTIKKVSVCKMGPVKQRGPNGEVIGERYEKLASVELPY